MRSPRTSSAPPDLICSSTRSASRSSPTWSVCVSVNWSLWPIWRSIYHLGYLLNGPADPSISRFADIDGKCLFAHLVKNPTRLADEILFYHDLPYSEIEPVAPGLAVDVLSRFTDFYYLINIDTSVKKKNVQRFRDLLRKELWQHR